MSDVYEPELVESEVVSPTALEAITRAEVDVAVSTAKRYPRSLEKFKARAIAAACSTQEIAESCGYYLERTDKDGTKKPIEGPSIRLAEICMNFFGNTRWGGRIIGEEEAFIVAQGVAHDLENNNFVTQETKRRVTTRAGKRFGADMIATTGAAAISIAMRNAAFRVIPRSYVEEVRLKAREVAAGTIQTLPQRWDRAAKYFAQFGVDGARLLRKLERESFAEVTLDDIAKLNGIRTAVKDGMTTVEEQFPAEIAAVPAGGEAAKLEAAPTTAGDQAAEKIEKKRAKKEPKAEPKEAAASPAVLAEAAVLALNIAGQPARETLVDEIKAIVSARHANGSDIDAAIKHASGGRYGGFASVSLGAPYADLEKILTALKSEPPFVPAPPREVADIPLGEWMPGVVKDLPTDTDTSTMMIRVLKGLEIHGYGARKASKAIADATEGAVADVYELKEASVAQLRAIHSHLLNLGAS